MEIKTLNEQIERLRELIRKCYGAVAGKNGTVPEVGERNMENLPAAIGSIKGITTDLVATENDKEYIANDYVVDGFGKVKTELRKFVKVSSFAVTDDCINEDGAYEDWKLLDFNYIKSLAASFQGTSTLKKLDVSNWDVSNVTNMSQAFNGCPVEELDVSNWDVSNVTNMSQTFRSTYYLKTLDVSNWDVSNVTTMLQIFSGLGHKHRIEGMRIILDLTRWETPKLTGDSRYMFSGISSIVGDRTIDDVIQNDLCVLKYLPRSINTNDSNLDRASLRAIINGLLDLTGQTAQTLTLGATQLAKLTEEDIAIATNKNWTITA